jgi:8-oxo-dGTP pyrophosphatase MutT (NUDIX family)
MTSLIVMLRKIAGWIFWPVIFFLLNNSERSRVVLSHGSEVLLIQGWEDEKYTLPGGGSKKGEAIDDCAIREVAEEIGSILDKKGLFRLGTWDSKHMRASIKLIGFGYALSEKPSLKLSILEVRSAKWVQVKNLSNYKIDQNVQKMIAASHKQLLKQG